ncbi:MAG: hypothetical protein WCR08_08420 [Gammaproteobacteria bacterium]|jgi:deoxyribonuclease-1
MPKKFSILLLLIFCGNLTWASPPHSFPEAKKIIYQIFRNHPKTLYCNCRYDTAHQVDLKSCHMDTAFDKKRAHVVEIEHQQ